MNDIIEKFREAMRRGGLEFAGEISADGKLHRFKAGDDREKNSWSVLHPGSIFAGAFGCWKRGIKETWHDNDRQLSQQERREVRRRWREAEREREREETERRAKAAKVADWIFGRAKPVMAAGPAHDYLTAKGVKIFGDVRVYRGALVLPLRDLAGTLHSLQFISPAGEKRYLSGGKIAGCFFTLADKPESRLVLCEGYATGASVHEAADAATVCVMNCGNLLAVAKALRQKFPLREIIIAGDNDAWTDGNPGATKAAEAATAIGARLALPQFSDTRDKPTDFNDLFKLEGADTVKTQIENSTTLLKMMTPAQWFSEKFPSLAIDYGDPILEATDEDGIVSAKDIGEDFLAATLGEKGSPDAPTVFVPTEERFFTYSQGDGIYIQQREPVLLARLSSLILACARDCKRGCDTQTLEFRFRDSANLSGVLRKARGVLDSPRDFFSTDLTEYIPCANGMLRLKDKMLLPFSPTYRRRNKLAVPFDPAAKCPLFLETLMRQALDDDELDLLQRWCGLTLIGENLAQRILILTGTAGGGKGTFIRVLIGIIGQMNLASLRPQLLGERFELGRFLGRTLLYGADVPENFLNQQGASVLKSLTGDDPVTLEFKNSNESPSIFCKFNVIVTCNSRLTVHLEGDTDAWRRRLAIVEYRKPKPSNIIADLDKRILATEASGVLNWLLVGLDKIRAEGWQLNLTAKQQTVVDNLLLESDGHAVFARECLKRDALRSLTVPDCFAAYVEFCNQRGWTALTRNKFASAITDEVVRRFGTTSRHDILDTYQKPQRGWKGLALTENFSRPTGETLSEVSETSGSDNSDTLFSVQPEKKTADALLL